MSTDHAVRQLNEELGRVAYRLVPLLGLDMDEMLRQRISAMSPTLAAQLRSDDADLAAETVVDVLTAIWGDADPSPEWWRSPVGRQCAASLGNDYSEAVSPSVAGAMLGISPQRVWMLIQGSKLERHPDGGVTRVSVMQRIAKQL